MERSKRVAVVGVGETSMLNEAQRLTITMPSGFKASVRETNGEDEDIVSRLGDNKEGNALYKFLSNVIQVDDKPVSLAEILKWKVRDIYYGIMKTRMFTHGPKVIFDHTFADGTQKTFVEDLGLYDWNLGDKENPPPQLGDENYDPRVIQPYRLPGEWLEGSTNSGKKYKFKYLTAADELKTLGMNADDLTINDKLRIREFQIFMQGGNWQTIERFNVLSSKEMAEIRTVLEKNDPEFSMMSDLRGTEQISLLGVAGFFFPRA